MQAVTLIVHIAYPDLLLLCYIEGRGIGCVGGRDAAGLRFKQGLMEHQPHTRSPTLPSSIESAAAARITAVAPELLVHT